jgi:hypothetical protein
VASSISHCYLGEISIVAGGDNHGFADGPVSSAKFERLSGIAFDEEDGAIYVTDYSNYRIRKIFEGNERIVTHGGGALFFPFHPPPPPPLFFSPIPF